MGNCCGCNIANRINGINIMILCAVVVINFWYEFDSAQGINCSQYSYKDETTCKGYSGCAWNAAAVEDARCYNSDSSVKNVGSCMKSMDMPTCQGRLAAGIFATLGALVSLFGACSKNPERNQSTVAAAFALINLAHAAFLFGEHENPLQGGDLRSDQYISGISNLIGALCGIVFALWSCKGGLQTNNLAFIMAIFFYAFSFTVTSWKLFDDSCSTEQLQEDADDTQGRALDGDACTMQAFGGVFGLACMLFCIFAAVQVCCKKDLQPRFQSFIICLSIGMIFGYWLSLFWFRFANATFFGQNECNTKDPTSSNKGFCFTQFLGGAGALAGMPIAVIAGLLFCMKCISAGDDDEDDYNSENPYGV